MSCAVFPSRQNSLGSGELHLVSCSEAVVVPVGVSNALEIRRGAPLCTREGCCLSPEMLTAAPTNKARGGPFDAR